MRLEGWAGPDHTGSGRLCKEVEFYVWALGRSHGGEGGIGWMFKGLPGSVAESGGAADVSWRYFKLEDLLTQTRKEGGKSSLAALRQLNTEFAYNPAILLLAKCPREPKTGVQTNTYVHMPLATQKYTWHKIPHVRKHVGNNRNAPQQMKNVTKCGRFIQWSMIQP